MELAIEVSRDYPAGTEIDLPPAPEGWRWVVHLAGLYVPMSTHAVHTAVGLPSEVPMHLQPLDFHTVHEDAKGFGTIRKSARDALVVRDREIKAGSWLTIFVALKQCEEEGGRHDP